MKALGFTHESSKAESVDWYSPPWIFEGLGLEFDLDPCSPPGGLPWIPAKRFISLPDNGRKMKWKGRVWLNPPYGDETSKWLARMHEHRNGIALVFARTDNKWFHDYLAFADALLFTKGRISFVDGLGVTGGAGAGAGSVFAAWGDDNVEALTRLSHAGFMVFPMRKPEPLGSLL